MQSLNQTAVLRVDVDTPTSSLLRNKLRIKTPYLAYLDTVFNLCDEFRCPMVFMFRVPDTLPTNKVIERIRETKSEAALHSEGISTARIVWEKKMLENKTSISGISFHGNDLDDHLLALVTRNPKFRIPPGTPFQALEAGFKYYSDGYCDTPTFLSLGTKRLLLFPKVVCLDMMTVENMKEHIESHTFGNLLFHPNYLLSYGLREPTLRKVRFALETLRKHNFTITTYEQIRRGIQDAAMD
jgi:hypothetical protein